MAKRHKAKLTEIHRAFLVREFACFATPQEAADALREDHGIEITPQGAQHYDATSSAGKQAANKWHELFDVARKEFLDNFSNKVPESHKAFRIHQLARASRAFKKNKNYMAMANMFERIAKEMGGAFTNRTEFTGKDRGPIKFQDIDAMTDDQIDAELRRLLNIDGARVQPAPESKQ